MKKIITVVCLIAMVFALSACASKGYDKSALQLSEYDGIDLNEFVQMFIKQKTVTDATESVALVFENISDKDYTFDAGARLEVLLDGSWYLLPPKSDAMTMAIYHLPAGSMEEGEFVFSGNYDKLSEGTYRIVKLFADSEGNQTAAVAEFTIGRG